MPSGTSGTPRPKSKKPAPTRSASRRPTSSGPNWGWIGFFVAIVVLGVGLVGYAVIDLRARQADAAAPIEGVVAQEFTSAQHTADDSVTVDYDVTPAFGGEHSAVWADCTGTVYSAPVRDENAVHSLEHGAVWIAYRPDLSQEDVAVLAKKVSGVNYSMMSPYPGLTEAVSVQTWGHQLRLDSVNDERLDAFIDRYRLNPEYTPEYGASCVNPDYTGQMGSDGSVSR